MSLTEFGIFRALVASSTETDRDLRWRTCKIDGRKLHRLLTEQGLEHATVELCEDIAKKFGISIFRTDDLTLKIKGFEKSFSRLRIAQALGSLGRSLFPTRNRAKGIAYQAARECLYFGCGPLDRQFMPELISLLKTGKDDGRGTIFRDLRSSFAESDDAFELLNKDDFLRFDISSKEDYTDFQYSLRKDPFDGAMVAKLSEFFNKRATIGIRDGLRWLLGARHPWFDWNRARSNIELAFKHHRDENFNTPQIVYYAWDPSLETDECSRMLEHNRNVAASFAQNLSDELITRLPEAKNLPFGEIAQWILDIFYDYPDFECEGEGKDGATHVDFFANTIVEHVRNEITGDDFVNRPNINMRAHFQSNGLIERYLKTFSLGKRETFFNVVDRVLLNYIHKIESDREAAYARIPTVIVIFHDLGMPEPQEDEALATQFCLTQTNDLVNAAYMRTSSDIIEKMTVFYTLVARHMFDTKHVIDLRPENLARDFMMLGLWGTRTKNIAIQVFCKKGDLHEEAERIQIKFVGKDQLETVDFDDIRRHAKLSKYVVSHFGPMLEPSIMRALATFVMAIEEQRGEPHEQSLKIVDILRYALDIEREFLRLCVKSVGTGLLNLFEYALDHGIDYAQEKLDSIEKKDEDRKDPSDLS